MHAGTRIVLLSPEATQADMRVGGIESRILIVRADGRQLLRKTVGKDTATDGHWLAESIDLSPFAGRKVKLELVNQPTAWSYEAAYWAAIKVMSD